MGQCQFQFERSQTGMEILTENKKNLHHLLGVDRILARGDMWYCGIGFDSYLLQNDRSRCVGD